MKLPELNTERLLLQPLTLAHSQGMFGLWSQPEVCRYSGSAQDVAGDEITLPAISAVDSDKIIVFFLHHQALGNGCRWAILNAASNRFQGIVGFNSLSEPAEIAYHLNPAFWGQGVMLEACRSVLDWVTKTGRCTTLEAFVDPENVASGRLASNLGMRAMSDGREGAVRYQRKLANPA